MQHIDHKLCLFYPKRLTNEERNGINKTKNRRTLCKCCDPS